MLRWKKALTRAAYGVEDRVDALKYRLRKRLGKVNQVMIVPYRGHGSTDRFFLSGRVIENRAIAPPRDDDSAWLNLLNMYRRFASEEIRGATVRARFGSVTQTTVADREGYFEFAFAPDPALLTPEQHVYQVELELVDYPGPRRPTAGASAEIFVPPPDAQFGVISDLDDTVIQSDVVNLLKLVRNTLLKNAHTRLPFEGVAAFYHALQRGTNNGYNPIYYVTSGPWNLYDLIVDFFEIRGIPAGPLHMTRLGLRRDQLIRPNRRKHKLAAIHELLTTYPDLPFLLIGDSGELDPEIYLQVVLDHPGRIKVIYIRDVGEKKRANIQTIAAQVKAAGSELLPVQDTVEAALHASANGYILPEALPYIRQERSEDKTGPNPVEQRVRQKLANSAEKKG